MKLRTYAAIILSSAVLVSQTPAIAQMAPKPEAEMPKTEMPEAGEMPKAEMSKPSSEIVPDSTPIAPAATPEIAPVPEMKQPEMTAPETTQPTESMPLPTLESTPTAPTAAPAAMAPSGPVPAAMTLVLPQETITGIKTVSLPEPMPIRPAYFTLPITLKVAQDVNTTSSTPISDRYTGKANWDLAAWTAGVRNCLQQKPKLMRVVGDQTVPFMLNGAEGTIMMNADNQAVCPM